MKLKKHLKNLIVQTGAISMAQFMQVALSHPDYGYYKTKEPFGAAGDFTTAPEISQMFGELIGIWVADIWLKMGSPSDLQLVEIGPGRGTLMDDLLRATKNVPGFHDSISISMVETSKRLASIQQEKLNHKHPRINWLENISEVAQKPMILVANELFDALPVHQYVKQNGQWHEKMLGLDGAGELEFATLPLSLWESRSSPIFTSKIGKKSGEGNLVPPLNSHPHPNPLPLGEGIVPPNGAILETSPLAITIMEQICSHIKQHGGAALIIDYGYTTPEFKDTISAILNHKHHSLLDDIGKADLSAHVDFGLLRNVAEDNGVQVYGAISQGEFLKNMGIDTRVARLSQNATEQQKHDLQTAQERLTGEEQMGNLFKVLAVCNSMIPTGF